MIPVRLDSWEVQVPSACVLTDYGAPAVLRWQQVELPQPAAGQIRLRVRAAGVGPTDLEIRRGDLRAIFSLTADSVLGFEASGVADALGEGVQGISVGDEVAAWLPSLGRLRRIRARVLLDDQVAGSQLRGRGRSAGLGRGCGRSARSARGRQWGYRPDSRGRRVGRHDRHPNRALTGCHCDRSGEPTRS